LSVCDTTLAHFGFVFADTLKAIAGNASKRSARREELHDAALAGAPVIGPIDSADSYDAEVLASILAVAVEDEVLPRRKNGSTAAFLAADATHPIHAMSPWDLGVH
jgi:hypothetical protein